MHKHQIHTNENLQKILHCSYLNVTMLQKYIRQLYLYCCISEFTFSTNVIGLLSFRLTSEMVETSVVKWFPKTKWMCESNGLVFKHRDYGCEAKCHFWIGMWLTCLCVLRLNWLKLSNAWTSQIKWSFLWSILTAFLYLIYAFQHFLHFQCWIIHWKQVATTNFPFQRLWFTPFLTHAKSHNLKIAHKRRKHNVTCFVKLGIFSPLRTSHRCCLRI